jgi:hypothetical protein
MLCSALLNFHRLCDQQSKTVFRLCNYLTTQQNANLNLRIIGIYFGSVLKMEPHLIRCNTSILMLITAFQCTIGNLLLDSQV